MTATPDILPPYTERAVAGRRVRPVSLLFMIVYCGVTGAAVALLPPQLMFLLAAPVGFAVAAILWLMPDGGKVPDRLMATLLVIFVAANCLWPAYISIALPGLPWINPSRIVVGLLLVIGLYSYSTSSQLRAEVAARLAAIPLLRTFFWIFWGTTLITIPLSQQVGFSINKFLNNQVYWTFLFLGSAWLASKPGLMTRVSTLIVWTTILLSLETIYEFHIELVPWANHIPSFLRVDEQYLHTVLGDQSRAGTDLYRARGTFSVSLICAEYLAIVYPFLVHETIHAKGPVRKLLLVGGLLATLAALYLTGARSAMVGFFLTVFAYGGFALFREWRRNKTSLFPAAAMAMYPLAAMIFIALMFTWPRLHNMTIGGGQHQPSSEARKAQWAMGTPMVERNPIGHGPGRAGGTLGYTNLGGDLTIDTYYLSLLLEYGVIGFFSFMALFGSQLYYGLRMFLIADPGEETLVGPTTVALLNFLVIKAVLSSEFNIPIAFILLGFIFATAWRQQLRLGLPAGARNALPAGVPA